MNGWVLMQLVPNPGQCAGRGFVPADDHSQDLFLDLHVRHLLAALLASGVQQDGQQIVVFVADTPYYVLNDEDGRIGPKVIPLNTGVECMPIYGLSDKRPYDRFCAKSELALKPYPLVKGYLRNQIDALGDVLKLVVIDARGRCDPDTRSVSDAL